MFGAASNVVSTDAMLVSAIRSGDEQAMAQLYERYSPIVYSVALRVLGNTAAAEDILQEVFMQLLRLYRGVRKQERSPAFCSPMTSPTLQRWI